MNDFQNEEREFRAIRALYDEGRHREALAQLGKMVGLSDVGRYHELSATINLSLLRASDALADARRAIAAGRDTPETHRVAGAALYQLGFQKEAWAEIKLAGEDPAALLSASHFAWIEGRYAETEDYARRALALVPDYPGAWARALQGRAAQGDNDAWNGLLRFWQDAGEPAALRDLLDEARRRGSSSSVDAIAKKAFAHTTEDPQLLYQVGYHLHGRDSQWVLSHLQALPDDLRDDPLIRLLEGQTLLALGRYSDAVVPLEKAFDAQPGDATIGAYYCRSLVKSRQWLKVPKLFLKMRKAVLARP